MISREKYVKQQISLTIIITVLLCLSTFLVLNNFSQEKKEIITYHESGNVNYKVFLKKNNYFEKNYLDENRTYITSLIDHLNVTFRHGINFDKNINGEYRYRIIAQIEANKQNNEPGNYWTKEFVIKEGKRTNLNHQTSYQIVENVNIDYNKYNNLLKEFTTDVGLPSADGLLKVYLIVNSNIKSGDNFHPLKKELMLKIPLSETAVEIKVDSPPKEKISQIVNTVEYFSKKYIIKASIGAVLLLISVILIFKVFRDKRKFEKTHKVENSIRKFLNTYDSIIVNIEKLPDISDYHVINVENFNELIDAHGEIRMPINYYKEGNKNVFLLLNDKTVWYYEIENKEGEEKDEK